MTNDRDVPLKAGTEIQRTERLRPDGTWESVQISFAGGDPCPGKECKIDSDCVPEMSMACLHTPDGPMWFVCRSTVWVNTGVPCEPSGDPLSVKVRDQAQE